MIPGGDDSVLVRTLFTDQRAWEGLLGRIAEPFPDSRIVDDPALAGIALDRLLALIPDTAGYAILAVADRADQTVLVVDLTDESRGRQIRCEASFLSSLAANLDSANMAFSDYADALDSDGVFKGFQAPPSPLVPAFPVNGPPALTELLPNGTLRHGSVASPSGTHLLTIQDDGDLVVHRLSDGAAVWHTGTRLAQELLGLTSRLVLRDTGELVLFEPTGVPVWSSGTAGREVHRAVVSDAGHLLLLGPDDSLVWSSGD